MEDVNSLFEPTEMDFAEKREFKIEGKALTKKIGKIHEENASPTKMKSKNISVEN